MNATDYLRARAKLDRDHHNRIKHLDDIWAILNGDEPPPQPIEDHDDAVMAIRGGWQRVARQVIDDLPDTEQFTTTDIESAMRRTNPLLEIDKSQIWMFLKKAVARKEIDIVAPGAGRRAVIYQKHSNTNKTTNKKA